MLMQEFAWQFSYIIESKTKKWSRTRTPSPPPITSYHWKIIVLHVFSVPESYANLLKKGRGEGG